MKLSLYEVHSHKKQNDCHMIDDKHIFFASERVKILEFSNFYFQIL